MKLFLVVDIASLPVSADPMYRRIILTGCTYTEDQFRAWVNDRWKVPLDAPLAEHVAGCARGGGWAVLEIHAT